MASKKQFDADRERELFLKAQQGDRDARILIHKEYKGLLDQIARPKAIGQGQPPIAARIEATKLLNKYIDSWNPTFSNKPSTYIYSNIDKKLNRYLNDRAQTVRMTEYYGVDTGKYTSSVGELTQQLGRKPSDEEVLADMQLNHPDKKFSLEHIRRIKEGLRTTVLASGVVGTSDEGSNITVGDLQFSTGDDEDIMHEMAMDFKLKEMLNQVDTLPEPERTIVLHTYGLKGYPQLSLRELAVKLGLNKYKVGVHLNNAMEKLRSNSMNTSYTTGFVPYGGYDNPYD